MQSTRAGRRGHDVWAFRQAQAALASVPYGIVLVRVRRQCSSPMHRRGLRRPLDAPGTMTSRRRELQRPSGPQRAQCFRYSRARWRNPRSATGSRPTNRLRKPCTIGMAHQRNKRFCGDALDGYSFLIDKFVGPSISLSGRGLSRNGPEDQQVMGPVNISLHSAQSQTKLKNGDGVSGHFGVNFAETEGAEGVRGHGR